MSTLLNVLAAIIVIPVYMTLYFCILIGNWVMDKFVKEKKWQQ